MTKAEWDALSAYEKGAAYFDQAALFAEAIELLRQVVKHDPHAEARITVFLLRRRDDGTLAGHASTTMRKVMPEKAFQQGADAAAGRLPGWQYRSAAMGLGFAVRDRHGSP